MSEHNTCFWEVIGISRHGNIPRLYKNNQDSPNDWAEGKHYHEMKDNQVLMGLAAVFPGRIEINSRSSVFDNCLPCSLGLGLAGCWFNKAVDTSPWTHHWLCSVYSEGKAGKGARGKRHLTNHQRSATWPESESSYKPTGSVFGLAEYFHWCLLTGYRFHLLNLLIKSQRLFGQNQNYKCWRPARASPDWEVCSSVNKLKPSYLRKNKWLSNRQTSQRAVQQQYH